MGHLKVIWLSWVSKLWYQNKTNNPGAHVGPSHGEDSEKPGGSMIFIFTNTLEKTLRDFTNQPNPGTSKKPGNRHLIGVSIIRVLRHRFWQKRGRGWQWALSKKNRTVQKIKEWIHYNCLMKIWINIWIWLLDMTRKRGQAPMFPFFSTFSNSHTEVFRALSSPGQFGSRKENPP